MSEQKQDPNILDFIAVADRPDDEDRKQASTELDEGGASALAETCTPPTAEESQELKTAACEKRAALMASKHQAELKRIRQERAAANAPLDQRELACFWEAAAAFYEDEAEFRSQDPRKDASLNTYAARLRGFGLEYSVSTIRRRFVACFVRRRLEHESCSVVNKLSQSHLVALDDCSDQRRQKDLAEMAVRDGISARRLGAMVEVDKKPRASSSEPKDEELEWTAARVSKRLTTVVQEFRKQFRDAPVDVREGAVDHLMLRLSGQKDEQ